MACSLYTHGTVTDVSADRITDPSAGVRRNHQTIHQHEDRLAEIDVQQRLGCRKFEYLGLLVEPVEALLAKVEQVVAQGRREIVPLDLRH